MADHALVERVITWLGNWDTNNAPKPTIVDRDDAEWPSGSHRSVDFELPDDNRISVASSPERITSAIGTEYDHRVEDAANVRIEAAHEDAVDFPGDSDTPGVADAQAFQSIVDEAQRVILSERTSFPSAGGVDYHTVLVDSEASFTTDRRDYYRYEFDVVFRGFEALP